MKKTLIFIICILYSFFLGVSGTIVLINKKETIPVLNEAKIEENSSIKSSIDKIYNAVLLIQNFQNNNLNSTGTGFVYKKDNVGYVITNYHVIENADIIKVVNMNHIVEEAKILGYDEYFDIAVLSIPIDEVLSVATIGDSTKLNLGDTLFTVGSPLGIEYMGTITKGILSGMNRKVEIQTRNGKSVMEVLQTDAAINPGNSGGPLMNINGEVIGVTSMKLVKDEIEGMGFAIPIELVTVSLDKLESGLPIERPYLGIQILDMKNEFLFSKYQIYGDDLIQYGVIITQIEKNSILNNQLQTGDIITHINNEEIKDSTHFKYILFKYNVGDTILVQYIRDGKTSKIEVRL